MYLNGFYKKNVFFNSWKTIWQIDQTTGKKLKKTSITNQFMAMIIWHLEIYLT